MIDVILEDILPNALMIGVDYDLFWTLNPKSLEPFTKAFSLKQEYDDRLAWTQGNYIRLAVASLLNKKNKYPERPLTSQARTEHERMLEIKRKFLNNMTMINSRFK